MSKITHSDDNWTNKEVNPSYRTVSRTNFIPVDWYGCRKKCPQKTKS